MSARGIRRYEEQTYAAMRVMLGFMFIWHGTSKLLSFPKPPPAEAPPIVLWVAGPIELLCGTLVMLGLFTRPAAFLSSGTMAFAYWLACGTKAFLPLVNGGELAAAYCFTFLFIAARGSGEWSVDAALRPEA